MKILVLGSEGVIGKSLCSFLSKNHEVTKWDIEISPEQDLRIGVPDMSEYDFVFFLAYDVGGSKYLADSSITFINNNVEIMKNVFTELHRTKIPFIFASSQMQNMNCSYGTLKRLGEHYTELLGSISVRFWNVYGPEEIGIKSHVIPDFIHQYKNSGSIHLMTTGSEKRQFLYTDDCSECLITIMNNFEKLKYKKYIDITNFEWITILDLAKTITDNITISTKIDSVQTLTNEPESFILDYWKPKITLKEGLDIIMKL